MARRLILDTGILVTAERAGEPPALDDGDDIVIAAVTVAELLVGVELASDAQREARAAYVDRVLAEVPVEPYDLTVVRHHADLLAFAHRSGRARGAHDLLIAATARATGRTILTRDESARYDELPGVSALVV